ncbi:MAG: hypothetical protein IPL50_06855 [Chitinophagaceae bacterium]|nr:hypothetical protein [Chitinophagaceae bacterium]
MRLQATVYLIMAITGLQSCQKETSIDNGGGSGTANVNFIFKFDSTQARLNAIGQPAPMPAGNAGQSPRFNTMSAHYVEMTPSPFTALGAGAILYRAPEVTTGGSTAIDFSRSKFAGNNQVFLTVPVKSFVAGTYTWLRVSLAYQNYNVYMNALGQTIDATVASFIGFNTYLNSYKVKDSTVVVNANKLQGYWAVEGKLPGFGFLSSGQAPPGATTVPNPLFASSPIPAGSCLVTAQFVTPLIITGNETSDINIIVSLSTNKSFEWIDVDNNGTFDPNNGDQVIDMGIRGMIPYKQ